MQKAINTLKTTLGVRVNVNPEWSLLLSELETFYPDKATFVPSVARTVEAFCTALTAVADNDGGDDDKGNEEFGDELIDKIEGTVWIHVEVSDFAHEQFPHYFQRQQLDPGRVELSKATSKHPTNSTTKQVSKNREISLEWSPQQKGFIIKLAKAPSPSPSYIQSLFAGALASPSFFSPKKAAIPNTGTATTASPSANTSAEGGGDDWADVSFDNATGKAAVVEVPHRHAGRAMRAVAPAAAIAQFDMIPDVSTISRPDDLLLKPPYHLIVKAHSQSSIEVECSHSPTLQFLSDYLQKWCRTNHNRTDTVRFFSLFYFHTPLPLHPNFILFCVRLTNHHITAARSQDAATSVSVRPRRGIRPPDNNFGAAVFREGRYTDHGTRACRGRSGL